MSALTIARPLISETQPLLLHINKESASAQIDSAQHQFEESIFIDFVSPQTTTAGVIEATVRALKDELRQFVGRYTEVLESIESGPEFQQFTVSSLQPKTSSQIFLTVEKVGRGRPTVAFELDDLLEDEIGDAIIN